MTVSSTSSSETFNCDGVTVAFTCPFRVLSDSEMRAYLITVADGSRVLLENGVDYNVSNAGTDANAICTTVATYSALYQLKCQRRTNRLQETDYRDNDPFPAESHEAGLDRSIMIAQELDDDVDRTIRAPDGESLDSLPDAATRAGCALVFDTYGSPSIMVPASGSAADVLLQLADKSLAGRNAGLVGFDRTLNYAAGTIGATFIDWNPKDFPWLAKFDGVTDDTAALLACQTAIYNAGGGNMRPPAGTALVTSWVFNWAAARTVNIIGAGEFSTFFKKTGATTTPVFDFSVDVGVLDVYSTFKDFTIIGNAKAHHGFRATRLANVTTENLGIQSCDVGFESVGCLVSRHIRPGWQSCNIGFRCRKSAAIYCNLVEFQAGAIRACSTFGMDIGDASGVKVGTTDIETCGTAGNTATGGVMIRSTVDDEIGYSLIAFDGTWFEANLGRTFQTEAATGLYLTMRAVNLLSPEANRSANIGAIAGLTMIDCNAPSAGDTVVTAANQSTIIGGIINTITDTGVGQTRINVGTNAGLTQFSTKTATLGAGGLSVASTSKITNESAAFTQGNAIVTFQDSAGAGDTFAIFQSNGGLGNAAATSVRTGKNSVTGRSINSPGTINAAGADYAEYETKSDDCRAFAKGDVVGFDAQGLLTHRWSGAITFGLKSTDPSYVGGDAWFSEERPQLSLPPDPAAPAFAAWSDSMADVSRAERAASLVAYAEACIAHRAEVERLTAEHTGLLAAFEVRFEEARQKVDRVAYAGKVPVNMQGAQPGDWIVAAQGPNDTIVPAVGARDNPHVLGLVRNLLPDGRPVVVVKAA